MVEWCKEFDVHTLSMWGFSTDNAKRDSDEIEKLFGLFKKYLDEIISRSSKKRSNKEKKEYDVRIKFLGRKTLFPNEIQLAMNKIEDFTKNNKKYTLNLLLGYGGREEIIDTINAIIKKGIKEVDEKTISENLYTAGIDDPNIIIRTSGEQRLSGLMPWQSVYSEFYFSKKLWPDFSKKDFEHALKTYEKRKRRFGK